MQVRANGTTLEVEVHGAEDAEPLLLIMGLGMQLIAWHDGLVEQLVQRGFRVIRFDNRDAGLSQRYDHLGTPNVLWQSVKHWLQLPVQSPYALADMAADAAGLLDALGIASAHVCGASMGGMIAQRLAVDHAPRVRSLTLMMTGTGARHLPGPTSAARSALLARPSAPTHDVVLDHYVHLFRVIGSPDHPTPEAELRASLSQAMQRGGMSNSGVARQLVAIAADGDRTALLRRLAVPTQVIHGQADPLIPLACGRQLAEAIAGARFDAIAGMGHDLPRPLWPRFADGMADAAERARSSVRAG